MSAKVLRGLPVCDRYIFLPPNALVVYITEEPAGILSTFVKLQIFLCIFKKIFRKYSNSENSDQSVCRLLAPKQI